MIKGETVQLTVKTQSGTDAFGAPVYTEELVDVDNVLIGQPTTADITESIDLYGKLVAYVLGIPKGDTHTWTDTTVTFWGERFRTVGYPQTGIQDNIPGPWGTNVKVERYG